MPQLFHILILAGPAPALWSSQPALGQQSVRQVTAPGFGDTEQEAIENAKIEALSQVRGMMLKTKSESSTSTQDSSDGASFLSIFRRDVKSQTAGIFKSYRILENNWDATTSQWKCRIEAKVFGKYILGIDRSHIPSLAILPFKLHAEGYSDEVFGWSGEKFARELHQALIEQMTQSRKFCILEREDTSAIDNELARIQANFEAGKSSVAEHRRLDQKLGADYLLVGSISEFTLRQCQQHFKLTEQTETHLQMSAKISYRILDTASEEIR